MSQILSDNFIRANANPIAAPYATMAAHSGCQISGNVACPVATSTFCIVCDTTNVYPNDQYCAVTIGGTYAGGSGDVVSCILRGATGSNSYAQVNFTAGSTNVPFNVRVSGTNNALTPFTLPVAAQAGDTYLFKVQGQVYSIYQNGTFVASFTDGGSHLTAGAPGFGIEAFTSLTAEVFVVLFQAGSLVTLEAANDASGGGFQQMNGGMAA